LNVTCACCRPCGRQFGRVRRSTTRRSGALVGRLTGPYEQVAAGKPTTIDITYPDTLVPATPPAPPLPIPSAKTSHIDTLLDPQLSGGASVTNHIETVLFTDALSPVRERAKISVKFQIARF